MSQILMHWRQNSRRAMSSFFNHSRTTMMVCGDLKSRTLTAICCSSGVLVHEGRFELGFGAAEFVVKITTSRVGDTHQAQPTPPEQPTRSALTVPSCVS